MPDPEVAAEETAAELAEETVQAPEGFIALDKHQKDVNVQHKRFRDEERGRVKEKERGDQLARELEELRVANSAVVVPPVPDRYSDTYEADLAARDDAIASKAQQDADLERQTAERKEQDDARLAEQNEAVGKKVADFDSNMVSHGLNPAETKAAVDTLIDAGISNSFQDVLLEDKDGPLFVQYLAANPLEVEQMNAMTPYQLVNHLNGDIRAKAALLKPKTSGAPNPPITLSGGGAPETAESWERGAKYE